MIGVATVMYTTSYLARDCTFEFGRVVSNGMPPTSFCALWHAAFCLEDHLLNRCFVVFLRVSLWLRSLVADKVIQHKHVVEKEALHEYYEKHGGAPDHH